MKHKRCVCGHVECSHWGNPPVKTLHQGLYCWCNNCECKGFKEAKNMIKCPRDDVELEIVESFMSKEIWCCPKCRMKVTLEDEE